jgi:hypothetical protein
MVIAALLASTVLLSAPDVAPDPRKTGHMAASMWCYKQTVEQGRPCQVKAIYFSAKDDLLVLGAAVFVELMGTPMVLTMRYRYGTWYIDDLLTGHQ